MSRGKKKKSPKISIHIKITGSLATRNGVRTNYRLSIEPEKTFAFVLAKLRHIMNTALDPAEALYMFIGKRQTMPRLSATVGSYNNPNIQAVVTSENTFGAWSRMYVRSSIEKLHENGFIASVVYSYYGLTEFSESHFCDSLEKARHWILLQRTGGCLVEKNIDKSDKSYT
jgi:hypothetical protein